MRHASRYSLIHLRVLLASVAAVLALTLGLAPTASAQLVSAIPVSAQDAGACATANACASFGILNANAFTIDVSGTFVGTLTFESSVDGVNWRGVTLTNLADGSTATTTTAPGSFSIPNSGLWGLRVRMTAYTSGTANVSGTRGFLNAKLLTPTVSISRAGDGSVAAPSYTFASEQNTGIFHDGTSGIGFVTSGTERMYFGAQFTQFASGQVVGWASGNANGALDTVLVRDAANTLAQRNATNAQQFNLYGTFTDATHWEGLQLIANVANGGYDLTSASGAGGGTVRDLRVGTNGSAATLYLRQNGTNYWKLTSSGGGGHFVGITPGGGLGYGTGAGGAVTQITSKSTGVTLNTVSGQITMQAAALAAAAKVSFIVTDSAVATTDNVFVSIVSGGTASAYRADVTAIGSGSFTVTVENITAGSLSEAPVVRFSVLKGAIS